jgi:hypothetical protein
MPQSPLHLLKRNKNLATLAGLLVIVAVLFAVTIIKITTQQ